MNRTKRILNIIEKNFNDFSISVIDDSLTHKGHNNFDGSNETHLKILLKSKIPQNINRLIIHRKINELLKKEFLNGLHSLEIKINLV